MIRTVIVEDEEFAVLNLTELLKMHAPDVNVIKVCASGREALAELPGIDFDLLFLDIQFNDDFDAFELLKAWNFQQLNVVFVTSYDRYAIEAFRYNAIDYITKPIDEEKLVAALQKVRNQVFRKEELEQLLKTIWALKDKQIIISSLYETHFVNPADILYFQADKDYSKVFYYDGKHKEKELLTSKNLRYWDDELKTAPFLRIHKSYLVNMEHISVIKRKCVVLSNNSELDISRDRRKELEVIISEYKTR